MSLEEMGKDGGSEGRAVGMWESIKKFLTKGSARWSFLLGVGLLAGVAYTVYTNKGAVRNLRQQYLLKDPLAVDPVNQAVRRSLSGSDPVHREWDDVKSVHDADSNALRPQPLETAHVKGIRGTGDSLSQFVQATSRSSTRNSDDGTVTSCASQCDANGYSAAVAGATAAKACLDVCLDEHKIKGSKAFSLPQQPQQARPSPIAKSAEPDDDFGYAKRLLEQIQSEAGNKQRENAMMMHDPHSLKSNLPKSFAGIVEAIGQDNNWAAWPQALPTKEQAHLQNAIDMDRKIASRETNDRAALKKGWNKAVVGMKTLDAARLENAQALSKATTRAVAESKATLALDKAVLKAASQYQQNIGTVAGDAKLPVNEGKAEHQLAHTREDETQVERAAQFAGEILEEETLKWNNRQSLVHRQLNNPTFIDPGADAEAKLWAEIVQDAESMPKAEAGKVRLAAMSDGKLQAMQKQGYQEQRARMVRLGSDVRHMQAARAANAATLAKHMQKKALEKQADMQLLKAEARYKSTLSQIGGKSEVGQLSAKQLSQEIINEAKAAQALQLAAKAGSLMAGRYSSSYSISKAERAQSAAPGASGEGGSGGSVSGGEAAVSGIAEGAAAHTYGGSLRLSGALLGHEAHRKAQAEVAAAAAAAVEGRWGNHRDESKINSEMTGAEEVRSAADGWWHPVSNDVGASTDSTVYNIGGV